MHPTLSRVPLVFTALMALASTVHAQVADGTLRGYFTAANTTPSIRAAALDAAGRVTAIGTSTAAGAFRLNTDGSRDTTFSSSITYNNSLNSILLQADGRILVGGLFTLVNSQIRPYIIRLNADGTLDNLFPTNTGGTGVEVLAPGSGGKFYAGKVNGYGLQRYDANGVLDASFLAPNIGTGQVNGKVYAVKELADGKVMVSHQTADNATTVPTARKLERLTSTGALDTTFNVPALNAPVHGFEVLPDGRVAIIGEFTSIGGVARTRLALLKADGALDTSFDPGAGMEFFANSPGFGVKFLGNKLYFYGDITQVNGAAIRGLVRLNLDGTTDSTFAIGTGGNARIGVVLPAANGDLFIGGNFSSINGQACNRAGYLALNDGGPVDAFTAYLDAAQVPAGKRGPLDDADDDGIPNLMEYALDLRVMVPDRAGLPVLSTQGMLSLTYRHAHNEVTYTVQTSTDLGVTDPWTTTGVTQGTPGPDGTTTASIPLGATRRFLRLQVTR